jgi:platelet-activating factor acetylhydrolase
MATAAGGEEWKRSGIIKVAGIPAPSGPYEVGTVELMSEGTLVRLYYPTNRQGAENYQYSNCRFRDIYIKRSLEILGVKLPWLFSGIINYLTYPKSPARQNAPLISPPETEDSTVPVKFPVIVFSHGLAGNFCLYNAINCDFASHGYVVASLEHKDGSSSVALRRVQPPGVPEGDYNRYVDEWIPYNNAIPMMDPKIFLSSLFTLRNSQVNNIIMIYSVCVKICNVILIITCYYIQSFQ